MTPTRTLSSPLSWTGGKHLAARRIRKAFSPDSAYGTYVEVFGGAAHVLIQKPPGKQIEVFNDLNGDLIRFWMTARSKPEALQARLETLPYSPLLYHHYRESLSQKEPLTDLEHTVRWFYVLRSSFGGGPDFSSGWAYTVKEQEHLRAHTLRTATALLTKVAERFREVQIEHQGFERLIQAYQTPRTLLYTDPPYFDCEDYYAVDGVPPFTPDDHRRLAALLNATPALVALSYYEHPLLDELYPRSKWRRMAWTQAKSVENTRARRKRGCELLLMNYPETFGSLWQEGMAPSAYELR